ncbi:DUF6455 family protein [Azospirillum sp. SYSU D00513]|uniref:DUF6455 family protein n=1 Tax=Azospirillum sp. SYSU D00513 TaxID=2812561 RepID=UPI001A9698C9|nr:DUF6455 family protein [Azospirillum sp. SYSU D00513]
MSSIHMEPDHAHPLQGPFERLLEPLRGWLRRGALRRDLAGLPAQEAGRVLSEAGLQPADLPALLADHGRAERLLPRMAARYSLDLDRLADAAPHALRDLQRVCISCSSERRCARALSSGDAADAKAFCLNAEAIAALAGSAGPRDVSPAQRTERVPSFWSKLLADPFVGTE